MICSSLCRVLLLTFSSLGSGELTFQMVEFSGIGQNQQGSAPMDRSENRILVIVPRGRKRDASAS